MTKHELLIWAGLCSKPHDAWGKEMIWVVNSKYTDFPVLSEHII